METSKKEQIEIPCNLDYFYKSPQVRYRAWFPNDTELYAVAATYITK